MPMAASTPGGSPMLHRQPHSSNVVCLLAIGVFALSGCMPYWGNYQPTTGYPPTGAPPYATFPVNRPNGQQPIVWSPGYRPPLFPTPFPNRPQHPGGPLVLTPVPQQPGTPSTPVTNPKPSPQIPADVTAKWVPWPLPTRSAPVAQHPRSEQLSAAASAHGLLRTSASTPTLHSVERYASAEAENPAGTTPFAAHDLVYRGGKTLPSLAYVNLYLGGEPAGWTLSEVDRIEGSLAAALNDQQLNNVLMQYFNNQKLTTITQPPHPLIGETPSSVSRGDIQHYIEHLADSGYLNSYDTNSTVFNFILPPGTTLNDAELPQNAAYSSQSHTHATDDPSISSEDSTAGLAGYHGSVHHNNRTIYFSTVVYSQRGSDGTTNGIPVFEEPWKNVCATLYHQICEFRTDPDVEDALRDPANPASIKFLGWTSESGDEIGDYALQAGDSLRDALVEIPLGSSNQSVPIQLMYSNAAHSPEGPIPSLHPAAKK